MKKIYIAGPMTGMPVLNRPAFNRYALDVKKSGNIPLNPAVLPGWTQSKGAKMEHAWAEEWDKRIVFVQEAA